MKNPSSLHGLLIVNKPRGITSHDVVAQVRKILNQKAVGHTGTLDPFAEGVMVLVLGQATKLSDQIRDDKKSYDLTVKFGKSTDTLDRDGEVTAEAPLPESIDEIEKALHVMTGPLELSVPYYSAIKIKGKKLYEYARAQTEIELPKKKMEFFNLQIHDISLEEARVSVEVSKGSYIRSWADELGKKLGSLAFVDKLRRRECSGYNISQALDLETLCVDSKNFEKSFFPWESLFPSSKILWASPQEERLMRNGQIAYSLKNRLISEQKEANNSSKTRNVRVLSQNSGKLFTFLELRPQKNPKIHQLPLQ